MAGITDILSLLDNLPSVFALAERIFFLAISLFLGSAAWNGWKRYKNWGINIVASLACGMAVLAGAVLLGQLIPFEFPYIPYALHALIMAVLLHITLRLLSGDAQQIGKLVKGETFKKLKKEFTELKEEFVRLIKLLERKKIMPEPMTAKGLEHRLLKILEDMDHKEFRIVKKKIVNDVKIYNLKIKADNYEARLDVYTGELISLNRTNLKLFKSIGRAFKKLLRNKKVLAGSIMAGALSVTLLLLVTPESITKIQSNLDLSLSDTAAGTQFDDYEVEDVECLSVTDFFYYNAKGQLHSIDGTSSNSLLNTISEQNPGYNIIPGYFYDFNGSDYALIIATTLSNDDFNGMFMSLMTNPTSLLSGIDLCNMRSGRQVFKDTALLCTARNNNLCECKPLNEVSDYCDDLSSIFQNSLLGQAQSGIGGLLGNLG